jgi:hypothetical protein
MAPVILDSARRHGVADEDMLHALRNTTDTFPDQGDWRLTVAVGPARNGVTMLEIGFDLDETGRPIVVHAMNARRKYLRGGVI